MNNSIKNKLILRSLSLVVLGCLTLSAQAALINGQTTLSIDTGFKAPVEVAPGTFLDLYAGGSYFTMNNAAPTNGVMISGFNGVLLGQGQPAGTGSHGGFPLPGDTGAVTAPWQFFGNSGHEFTANDGVTVQSETGNTAVLDFSNWRVTWNGIPAINMGGSSAFGDTGLASMSCWGDSSFSIAEECSDGSFYFLDYAATVPPGDPSNFGGVPYGLHLEGIVSVSAVPVPAAVWLFGSGLIGLLGIARRKPG